MGSSGGESGMRVPEEAIRLVAAWNGRSGTILAFC